MISKTRSFLDSRNLIGVLILLSAFAAVAGCSSATNTRGLVDASGNHPAGFVSTHPGHASPDGGVCKECHGSDLRGGIVNVSCFSASRNGVVCHASGPAGHPSGWAAALGAPQPHGSAARAANGFVGCQACHGTGTTPPANFGGGTSTISCYPCHAPTASSPHASAWRTGDTFVHTTTDPSNAQVCAQCHVNGASSPIPPPSPVAPAGTAPGCFNNTLCHGAGGHPAGWVAVPPAPQPHGTDAKAASGFPGCQTCHGANFAGTASSGNVSCFNNAACHGATATWPHAPAPWRASAGSTYTHTTTVETGNAAVCAVCHFPGSPNNPAGHPPTPAPAGTAPGCFNSTLCHGAASGHPAGWAQSTQHGPAAKAVPSTSGGFSYCKTCHGTGTTSPANFGGGTSGTSCYPCHGLNAPHPSSWIGGGPPHRTTNQGQANLDVCAECHRATAGTAGCFNGTLCHN